MGRGGAAFAVALAVATWSPATTAAQLRVELTGCGTLSGLEVASAVELELGAGPSGSMVVRALCDEAGLLIEVEDPVTDKRVVRRVPGIDVDQPGIARVVALLVAELVLASWAELLVRRIDPPSPERDSALARVEVELDTEARGPPDADAGSGSEGEPEEEGAPIDVGAGDAGPVERAPVDPEPVAAPASPGARLMLDVEGGARLRDLGAPFGALSLGIRGMARLDALVSLGARVTLEFTDIERGAGSISYAVVGAGLVVGIEAMRMDAFVLDLAFEARGAWIRLDGRPARSSVEGRAVDAALLDLELLLSPGFELGSIHVALGIAVGATVLGPTGVVSGEADITLPGVFGGLHLALGLR